MSAHWDSQFEQLPYMETIDDVAHFVINMVTEKDRFYVKGIRAALEDMEFSRPQIGLLDQYASPKLSAKLEKHLCGENPEAIPEYLEKAFWAPMIAAAYQILYPEPMGDMTEQQTRELCVALLYAYMQANISNMNLLMQTNAASGDEVKNSSDLAAQYARANIYQVYSDMPASHTIRVLQKGVMPQFLRAIDQEVGLDAKDMASTQKKLYALWAEDPLKVSGNDLLRPLDPFEWMRFSKPDTAFALKESEIAYIDSRKLLPPPHVPEV